MSCSATEADSYADTSNVSACSVSDQCYSYHLFLLPEFSRLISGTLRRNCHLQSKSRQQATEITDTLGASRPRQRCFKCMLDFGHLTDALKQGLQKHCSYHYTPTDAGIVGSVL